MINPERWIISNVANWIENYVSGMRPDIALALPVDEPMEEQRVKIDGCWKTGWKGDSCPTAVSKMPIQPPWSPNGKRDQLDGSTTSGGNAQLKVARAAHRVSDVLSLQAGWITDAAALHYNTGSIPMTLSFKWNAGSGLQCNITGNGMSTLWCECTTDTSRQISHCAAIANEHRPFRLVRPLVPAGRRSWHCAGNVRLAR